MLLAMQLLGEAVMGVSSDEYHETYAKFYDKKIAEWTDHGPQLWAKYKQESLAGRAVWVGPFWTEAEELAEFPYECQLKTRVALTRESPPGIRECFLKWSGPLQLDTDEADFEKVAKRRVLWNLKVVGKIQNQKAKKYFAWGPDEPES